MPRAALRSSVSSRRARQRPLRGGGEEQGVRRHPDPDRRRHHRRDRRPGHRHGRGRRARGLGASARRAGCLHRRPRRRAGRRSRRARRAPELRARRELGPADLLANLGVWLCAPGRGCDPARRLCRTPAAADGSSARLRRSAVQHRPDAAAYDARDDGCTRRRAERLRRASLPLSGALRVLVRRQLRRLPRLPRAAPTPRSGVSWPIPARSTSTSTTARRTTRRCSSTRSSGRSAS